MKTYPVLGTINNVVIKCLYSMELTTKPSKHVHQSIYIDYLYDQCGGWGGGNKQD